MTTPIRVIFDDASGNKQGGSFPSPAVGQLREGQNRAVVRLSRQAMREVDVGMGHGDLATNQLGERVVVDRDLLEKRNNLARSEEANKRAIKRINSARRTAKADRRAGQKLLGEVQENELEMGVPIEFDPSAGSDDPEYMAGLARDDARIQVSKAKASKRKAIAAERSSNRTRRILNRGTYSVNSTNARFLQNLRNSAKLQGFAFDPADIAAMTLTGAESPEEASEVVSKAREDAQTQRDSIRTQFNEAKKNHVKTKGTDAEQKRRLIGDARGLSIPLFSNLGQMVGGRFGGMLGMGFGFQSGAEMLSGLGSKGLHAATYGLAGAASAIHLGTAMQSTMTNQTKRLSEVSGQFAAIEAQSEIRQIQRDQRSAAATGGTLGSNAKAMEDLYDATADMRDWLINTIGPVITEIVKGVNHVASFFGMKSDQEPNQWDIALLEMIAPMERRMRLRPEAVPAFDVLAGIREAAAKRDLARKEGRSGWDKMNDGAAMLGFGGPKAFNEAWSRFSW